MTTDPETTPEAPPPTEPQPSGTVIDAHLVWARQLAKLVSIDRSGLDEAARVAIASRVAYLEGLLLGATPRTRAGALAQARLLGARVAQGGADGRARRQLRLALAMAARLGDGDEPLHL